jgi:UDP-GlcNAc:undecaprenyl-phosphate GlcNAc-1-phosphate transferase
MDEHYCNIFPVNTGVCYNGAAMQELVKILSPVLLISFLVTSFVTPLVRKLALKANIIDKPTSRKLHAKPIPNLGGIAIFIGFAIASVCYKPMHETGWVIFLGASLIISLGMLDDIFTLKPWMKLIGQIVVATMTVSLGISIDFLTNPFGGVVCLQWLSMPITVLWIVAIINMINLIDGLDGLAAGIAAISACILALVAIITGQILAAVLTMAIIGACLGFLRYNFSPAQIFMGDVGSMFLGYILAVISIIGVLKSTIAFSLVIPLLIFGIPISDTLYAIIRRFKNGQAIFKPDNGHFHHRLIDLGMSQKQVVLFIYIVSMLLGLIAVFFSFLEGLEAYVFFIISMIAIITTVFLFRKKRSKFISILQLFL